MTLRLLVDMNLSPSWVEVLRNGGFEAEHWSQLGTHDAPDSELFEWARTHGHIVFTHDLDFGAMLNATQAESPSVFQVRTDDVSPEALSPRTIAYCIASRLNSYQALLSLWTSFANASEYCH